MAGRELKRSAMQRGKEKKERVVFDVFRRKLCRIKQFVKSLAAVEGRRRSRGALEGKKISLDSRWGGENLSGEDKRRGSLAEFAVSRDRHRAEKTEVDVPIRGKEKGGRDYHYKRYPLTLGLPAGTAGGLVTV